MNILHLMSQTHLTGPEVYVATLCRKLVADGHHNYIVSDTLTVQAEAEYIPMSIHNRSLLNRLRNIVCLVKLCRSRNIDLIHAHSRAASWLANIVAKIAGVGYVSTVHGRQSRHAAKRKTNIYGRHIIVVCEHLADHLRQELNITDADIRVIRNGFE
ncbi:MAG: glycosyltransferase [Gammaproteobacteria bacterium]|nr:glycosyltransferase [Gammaproteobacteria bacterium]